VRVDGGTEWLGRPPHVLFDPVGRRVILTVTDAANLYRPAIVELDAY
jgi:hypothetical protein